MGQEFQIVSQNASHQGIEDRSFCGGRPSLPPGLPVPVCGLCHATQTFFFQVAMPESHPWSGRTVSVFACTSCAREDFLIPELIDGKRTGIDVPMAFLQKPRQNYALLSFPTGGTEVRESYLPKLEFRRWQFRETHSKAAGSKIGGQPDWIMEDEAPKTCDGKFEMVFLLQLAAGIKFAKLHDAPPQIEFSYLSGKRGRPSKKPYYELFLGNALYLFGTVGLNSNLIYPIVQK